MSLQLALLYVVVEQARAAAQSDTLREQDDLGELPVAESDAGGGSDAALISEALSAVAARQDGLEEVLEGDALLGADAALAKLRELIEEELDMSAQARGLSSEVLASITGDLTEPAASSPGEPLESLMSRIVSAGQSLGIELPAFGTSSLALSPVGMVGGVVLGGWGLATLVGGGAAAAVGSAIGGDSVGAIVVKVALYSQGIVADGYISGATVKLLDAQGNVLASTTTDAMGRYEFSTALLKQASSISASGGKDISTGLDFTVELRAPASATVINPLTTLVQSYLDSHPGVSADAAGAAVKLALGISASVDLLTTDPIALAGSLTGEAAQQAVALQIKAAQIANLLISGAAALMSANGDLALGEAVDALLEQLTKQVALAAAGNGFGNLALDSASVLGNVLNDAALVVAVAGISTEAVALIAAGNSIQTSSLLSLYEFQKVVQDDLIQALSLGSSSPQFAQAVQAITALLNVVAAGQKVVDVTLAPLSDSGTDQTDRITNIANPQVRVDLSGIAGFVKEGYVVKLLLEGNLVPYASAPVTAADLARGYLDFTLPNFTGSGSKTISIVVADGLTTSTTDPVTRATTTHTAADVASGFLAVTYDNYAAPLFGALQADTGASAGDHVTSNPSFTIAGLESGAVWQYKLVGGEWSEQVTSRIALLDLPVDGAVTLLLRQIDKAGNQSADTSLSFVLDRQAQAVSVALANDTGRAGDLGLLYDQITSLGDLSFTGLESGAVVQVSADGGKSWSNDSDFAAQEGVNSILVRQVDLAGNTSISSSLQFTLDTQAAAPSVSLTSDTGDSGSDNISSDARLTVSGLEASALVQYSIDGKAWSESFFADSLSTRFSPAEGLNTVYVRQIDAAGNVSGASAPLTFTWDNEAATELVLRLAFDTGRPGDDGVTNNGTVNLSGLESGARWFYSTDGGTSWSQGAGKSLTLTGDGAKSVLVYQQDAAGNVSADSRLDFAIDTSAPGAPVVGLELDSGRLATDTISNAGTLTTLVQEVGALIEYRVEGSDTWSSGFGAKEGVNTVYVRQTDVAGNVSESGKFNFTLDTAAPRSPVVALLDDTGHSKSDLITNKGALSVAAESDAVVEVSIDGGKSWEPLSDFAAISGSNTVLVRQTDAAGNVSTPATEVRFTLDTQVAAPGMALESDSGTFADDKISNQGLIKVSGLELGATWEFTKAKWDGSAWVPLDGANQQASGQVWQTGTGTSLTIANLIDDDAVQYRVFVRQTDVAGNVKVSSAFDFTLDVKSEAPSLTLALDSGTREDGLTNDGTVNVLGLEPGAGWTYSTDGGATWSVGSGSSVSVSGDGARQIVVQQIDIAGNPSQASNALAFTLDTQVAAPTLSLASDTGLSGADRITQVAGLVVGGLESDASKIEYSTNQVDWSSSFTATEGVNTVYARQIDAAGNVSAASNAFVFTYDTSAPGAAVSLVQDAGSSATDNISNNGMLATRAEEVVARVEYRVEGSDSWSSEFGAKEGVNSVYVRQTDVAGNVSESGKFTFTLDTAAPGAPAAALRSDSGASLTDLRTNSGELHVSAEVDALIEVSADGGLNWKSLSQFTAVGDFSGVFNTLLLRQTDVAGNVSSASAPLQFTLDTGVVAPELTLAVDSGILDDKISNQSTISVSGIESGATWEYAKAKWDGSVWVPLDGANQQATAQVWQAGTGSSLAVANDPADETVQYRVLVRQTDAAGNVSTSSPFDFTFDAKANAPSLKLALDSGASGIDGISNSGTVNVGGLEAGASWKYSTNGGVTWSAGSGSSVTLKGDGIKSLVVRQTDAAGNTSDTSSALGFKLDTQVARPVVALASDTGVSATDLVTKSAALTLTGLENAASTVEYSNDKTYWSSNFAAAQGSNTVYVRQTDVAGNVSVVSSALVFTYDTVAPTLTVGDLAGDGVLTSKEAQSSLLITGTTDAEYGRVVSLMLVAEGATSGKVYTGTVAAGTWSVLVPQADVAALTPGVNYGLTQVTVSDLAGNSTVIGTAGDALAVEASGGGADGYIFGATVFADRNGDGVLNFGETASLTDAVGNFSLPANGQLIMRGGVDVSTGLGFESQYEAPKGYRVINPITTLVVNKTGVDITVAGAEAWVKAALGMAASTTLGTYDPFRAATEKAASSDDRFAAISYQKVALELSNVMDVGATFLQLLKSPGLGADDALALRQEYSVSLIAKVAELLPPGALLTTKLADAEFVKWVLDGVAADKGIVGAETAVDYLGDVLATANTAINAVSGVLETSGDAIAVLTDAIKVQSATQGSSIKDALEAYANGGKQPALLVADATSGKTPLEQAIADAVTGVIVPARVSIDATNSTSAEGLFEGAADTTTAFNLTLTRGGNTDCVVVLRYNLATGTGVDATDFAGRVVPSGTVTFVAGQESLTLTIMVQGDDVKELTENFSVILTDPLGQTQLIDAFGNAAGSLTRGFSTINDDPFVPTFTLPDAIDLVAGASTAIPGVLLDYYKTGASLTLTVKSVIGVELHTTVAGVTTSSSSDGINSVLTLTGTLAELQLQLDALRVQVPATETSAYLAFSAVDATGAKPVEGVADIAMGLHHVATIEAPASLPKLMAGLETLVAGFHVADLDDNTLTVRLTPTGGVLDVSVLPTGLGMIQEDDGGLTLTGTALAVNLALDSLTITAVAGDVSITASVTDDDALTPDAVTANTAGSADAAPTALVVPEDLTVSAGNLATLNGIQVSDLDSGNLTLKLSATGGVVGFGLSLKDLSVGRTDTVSNGVTTITLSGDKANLNAALDSLTFKAGLDVATATVTVTADDGDTRSAPDSRTINLTVLDNDPPEAGGALVLAARTEDVTSRITISGLNLVNSDGVAPTAVRIVSVTGGSLAVGTKPVVLGLNGDVLQLGANGKLVLNLALSENYAKDVKISYVVVDPADSRINSLASTITVPVIAVNDAPVIAPNGLSYSFTEGATPVEILAGLRVTDIDSTSLSSARIAIGAGFDASDLLSVTLPNGSGLTSSFSGGVLTITGDASLANYQSVLRTVTFSNSSDSPSTVARQIAVTVTDNSNDASTKVSGAITRTVAVVGVNDAPTINKLGGNLPSVTEQTALSLAGLGFVVGDIDSGTNTIAVTIAVGAGQINAGPGISGATVAGSGTASVTLTGTVAAIGKILDGSAGSLTYSNTSDTPAAREQLTISVNDGGASGLGGALAAQASYQFSVIAVNDLPVVSLSSILPAQALYAASAGSALLSPQASVSDIDSSGFVAAQVEISAGMKTGDKLYLSAAASQTLASSNFSATYANGVLNIAPVGAGQTLSQANLESVLRGVSFTTSASVVGGETRVVVYTVTDNSGLAAGAATSVATSVTLTLQQSPFAAVRAVSAVQTLVFTGDPKSSAVTADLTTFRVLANGAPVSITGGNVFAVKNIDASLSTNTSVSLVGSSAANTLIGNNFGSTITGGGGADVLKGGKGNDTFVVGAGNGVSEFAAMVSMAGGSGTDTIRLVSAQTLTQTEWTKIRAVERIELAADQGVYSLTLGASAAASFGAVLEITGQALQSATLEVSAAAYTGSLHITGTDNGNILTAGAGDDTISGGAAKDTIAGGAGKDTLTGAAGVNTFVFNAGDTANTKAGADRITDLKLGDKLNFSGLINGNTVTSLKVAAVVDGGHNYLNVQSQTGASLAYIDLGTAAVPGDLASWTQVGGLFTVADNAAPVWTVPYTTSVQRLTLGGSGQP
ncbi:MAG: Ig-like domain-containing protein, partial [Rhodoferax sp.]|nr:Ig-like domain-containing protein [Rhodoferax sp.]